MLVLIAVANGAGVVTAGTDASPAGGVDRWLHAVLLATVHARAYPVFAVMFGYGLVQFTARQAAAGAAWSEIRAILVRRHLWLAACGVLHGILLYYGDFLGAYGVIGLLATMLLVPYARADRVVLWLWAFTAVHALVLAGIVAAHLASPALHPTDPARSTVDPRASLVAQTYMQSVAARVHEWPRHTLTVIGAIVIVWLGIWAGRRRMLEDLETHRRVLSVAAWAGLAIALSGGIPLALWSAGLLAADAGTLVLVRRLHEVSGMFGGPGYAALLGLWALRITREQPSSCSRRLTTPIAALGQRSLSGYVLQSIVWLVAFSQYTLHLGDRYRSPLVTSLAVAVVTWCASLSGAAWLQSRGHKGPAETVLRRLTYRRRQLVEGRYSEATAPASDRKRASP